MVERIICNFKYFIFDDDGDETSPKYSSILRLSGPLKECYAGEKGLDFEQMLTSGSSHFKIKHWRR